MRAIRANGVLTHVRDEGPRGAPALVFSNSLGTDLRVWDPLVPLLPPGLRLIRYDTRGHGLSGMPPLPWSIGDAADDLAAVMDALDVRAASICGLSVGGLVGQSLAARRPDLVANLVLMDTAAKIGTQEMWDERIRAAETQGIAAVADGIVERWFSRRFRADAEELGLWRAMLERTPARGYAALSAAIRDCDLTGDAPALRQPTLAIAGDEDGATPPDLVRATAELIPGARFEIVKDAGHLPCVEQPGMVGALIGDFFEDIGFAGRSAKQPGTEGGDA